MPASLLSGMFPVPDHLACSHACVYERRARASCAVLKCMGNQPAAKSVVAFVQSGRTVILDVGVESPNV